MAKCSPEVVARHNEVTRTIIVGAICEKMGACLPRDAIAAATEIMQILEQRGYKPHIRALNQLANGKCV